MGLQPARADLVRFARYIEAGTVEPADASQACVSILNRFRSGADEACELQRRGREAVREQAEAAARIRGRGPALPRRVRVPFDQRVAALVYLLKQFFDLSDTPEH